MACLERIEELLERIACALEEIAAQVPSKGTTDMIPKGPDTCWIYVHAVKDSQKPEEPTFSGWATYRGNKLVSKAVNASNKSSLYTSLLGIHSALQPAAMSGRGGVAIITDEAVSALCQLKYPPNGDVGSLVQRVQSLLHEFSSVSWFPWSETDPKVQQLQDEIEKAREKCSQPQAT